MSGPGFHAWGPGFHPSISIHQSVIQLISVQASDLILKRILTQYMIVNNWSRWYFHIPTEIFLTKDVIFWNSGRSWLMANELLWPSVVIHEWACSDFHPSTKTCSSCWEKCLDAEKSRHKVHRSDRDWNWIFTFVEGSQGCYGAWIWKRRLNWRWTKRTERTEQRRREAQQNELPLCIYLYKGNQYLVFFSPTFLL